MVIAVPMTEMLNEMKATRGNKLYAVNLEEFSLKARVPTIAVSNVKRIAALLSYLPIQSNNLSSSLSASLIVASNDSVCSNF